MKLSRSPMPRPQMHPEQRAPLELEFGHLLRDLGRQLVLVYHEAEGVHRVDRTGDESIGADFALSNSDEDRADPLARREQVR